MANEMTPERLAEITPKLLRRIQRSIDASPESGMSVRDVVGLWREEFPAIVAALREAWKREAALTTQVQSLQAQLWRQGNKPVFIDSWRNSDGS